MAFHRSPTIKTATPALRNQLILPVGRRAFVHLPKAEAVYGDFTPFGEKPGSKPAKELSDGQEVEIIGWRPMSPQGLSYHIQRLSDRREWWAKATCLRESATAAPAAG